MPVDEKTPMAEQKDVIQLTLIDPHATAQLNVALFAGLDCQLI